MNKCLLAVAAALAALSAHADPEREGLGHHGFANGGLHPGFHSFAAPQNALPPSSIATPRPVIVPRTFVHGRDHRHWRGGTTIVLGSPFMFGYPGYIAPYPATLSATPPVYIEQATDADIRAQPSATYFCPDYGYYPTVQFCPTGWLMVTPVDAPPAQ